MKIRKQMPGRIHQRHPKEKPFNIQTAESTSLQMNVDEEEIEEEKSNVRIQNRNEKTWQSPVIPGTGYPSVSVTKDDILQAVGASKRYTSGGLQQITPWHLKRAAC